MKGSYNNVLSPIMEERDEKASLSRIKVVVRVRPLNSKELSRGHKIVVRKSSDQSLMILDPTCLEVVSEKSSLDPSCWTRNFSFDSIFWSTHSQDFINYSSKEKVF